MKTEIVVIGAGPGGYAAAFCAADNGKKVVLVEQERRLGGVCLNRGCIPSKALLHATKLISEVKESAARGISFGDPKIQLEQLRSWKESILKKLGEGIAALAKKRDVQIVCGQASFRNSGVVVVKTQTGEELIEFEQAIIATGSKPALPPEFNLKSPRVITSDQALELKEIPENLLVVGGGYIGLELGTVYSALGSRVVLAEVMDSILAGVDFDLVRPVLNRAQKIFKELRLSAKVLKMDAAGNKIKVIIEFQGEKKEELYDAVLVSVGRVPYCDGLGLKNTKVKLSEKGFIQVNDKQQTSDPTIYAIGDVAGGPLLAHKASREAKVAIESIVGRSNISKKAIIPAVVFTDPEVAWCGLTEFEAKQKNIQVQSVRFPWAASGRALSFDRTDGVTKLIVDPVTERILGVGIAGVGAGELISEGALAVEMGLTAKQLGSIVHPHPTLSETLMECAELFYGTSTYYIGRKRS